ncbi:MAG: hypothetical protein HYX26_03305 [Acidobacteriales bacterium]|nr:hypothetical protein [Terriglobales bacterium]
MTRYRFSTVSLAALLLITTAAYAQYGNDRRDDRRDDQRGYGYNISDRAQQIGYRDGYQGGVNDRNRRDRFNYRDNRDWKRGDNGYDRSFGSKGQYKQFYRDAYAQGYEDGFYGRNTWGNNGTWGRSDRGHRDNDNDRDDRWHGRRDNGGYGNGGYGNNGSIGQRAGYDNGFQSGVYYGQLDRSAGRRPNPTNCKGYKDADRGYHSGYNREEFKVAFRDAFLRGYDQSYYGR